MSLPMGSRLWRCHPSVLCTQSTSGNRFFPAAALAPTTLQHLQNALITWLLVPLPTPTRQRAPRRPGSCLIPRGIMCWARGLTHSRAKEILLNGWTNGQKKMEFFLFSCHGVNSHFVVFWEYFQRVSKSYCVSDCNKAMCSGLWPNLLPARGWGSPLSSASGRREGQAACGLELVPWCRIHAGNAMAEIWGRLHSSTLFFLAWDPD